MIKILEGTRETVSFDNSSLFMFFDNDEYEEYPTHWHTPVEFVMPTESSYNMVCSGVPFHLRVNDILIIAPGVLHKCLAEHGKRYIFQADIRIFSSFKEFESFFSFMGPAIAITPEEYPSIHAKAVETMHRIKEEYYSTATFRDSAICSHVLDLMTNVSREFTSLPDKFSDIKPTKQQEYIEKFMTVCDYINHHCTEELSLEKIAAMTGFSKYHFSRLFKEFTNTSFYKYLNVRRIAHAEMLLLDPTVNVTETAVRSGFNSISAFMRMFKIIKGCTPTEFRNLYIS
ncbi:MAG: helix-turn-helix transcriptional regulator [Lachnospiraceae bacterium]|nr:helix-turn-helix transcriptional regulator [Lachnospiraceae bacterium]